MWNPEPPTGEPPKKKRKLSCSKVKEKLSNVFSAGLTVLFIGLT
jgi:hypothetical protein